ncbi:MAG: alpha-glucosidase C-terminal domain-containing protein, partial [Candidatus Marinimicrobia bacterium]|nr:alpha-glucosidase C-terminal domain-containing protein [Candidatus Neomarinimicrobiota bacterium]
TIAGVPVVYYGEEMGLMGAADPGNRRSMRFGSELAEIEQTTLERISALIKLRRQYPSLAVGDFVPLLVDRPVMVFGKAYFDEFVVVAFNQSAESHSVSIELPIAAKRLSDLVTESSWELANREVSLDLPPYSSILLKAE